VRPRTFLLALVALVVGVGAAVWLLYRITEGDQGGATARGAVVPEVPLVPPPPPMTGLQTLTPPEVADPVEARRLEGLIEARSRYQALRDGFTGPASEAARQRLEPALRALWPGQPPAYTVACRGRVCRVEGPGAPDAWRPQLQGSQAVARLVDRVVVDPDGAEKPAFLLVSEGRPGSGEDLLAEVERQLRDADPVAICLDGAPPGRVDLEVLVDQSGITYRAAGSAPPALIDCLGNALGALAAATRVPPETQAATRLVTFEVGR
jgi:hypothetical protein